MSKHYAITPVQRPGKTVFSATFKNASGIRVTRSLGTVDRSAAKMIAAGLVVLHNAGAKSFEDVPAGVPPESVRLYFEIKQTALPEVPMEASELANMATIRADLERFPQEVRAELLIILVDRYRTKAALEDLKMKHTGLKNDYDTLRNEYEALKRSVVARIANSAEGMPGIHASVDLFEKHLSTTTTRGNTKTHVAFAKKFLDTLPKTIHKLAEVRPEQIGQFLDDETARTNPTKPLARRRNLRIRLARFINWGAKAYQYPSQMHAVEGVKRQNLRRERGEIKWHELIETEAVIDSLKKSDGTPDPYWRVLVATLAYAGLQLSELVWLRKSDVTIDGDRGQIWVGPVTDPTDAKAKHSLKTGNRERHVDIHPKHLLPRLREFIATGCPGEVYFFPMPQEHRRRQRSIGGHSERWHPHTLSTQLRGHRGGKNQKKRPAQIGKLPKGMTAATLRHTFGSLLLRSKTPKSYGQVAASMGNSESVVAEFYARLKGSDVQVDF